jgi:Flp pilus assembly protein protease CpaA
MLGWILLAIGVVGFGYAGWKDLRTTEFEDWLPYCIIIAALAVRGAYTLISGDFTVITNSVFFGLIFLGFGYLLYFLRQWGDGDAWLMGALGFLFPDSAGFVPLTGSIMPFPLLMIFNFFLVALIYLIFYAIALGFRTPKVHRTFRKNLRERKTGIGTVFIILVAAAAAFTFCMNSAFSIPLHRFSSLFMLPFLAVAILIFFSYARAVEGDLFKRKIKANDLRAGDVLVKDKWRGLTEAEVKKLRKKGGEVWIKEGVRFAPVFVINVLVTLFIGNLMALIVIF